MSLAVAVIASVTVAARNPDPAMAAQSEQVPVVAKTVGVVKAISGNVITLTTDANPAVSVQVQASTRVLRIAPGLKDLKDATAIQFSEIETGDRILVRGRSSDDGKTFVASSIFVMKATDVAAKQDRDREDWQKRGVGGLVTAVDSATGTITISTSAIGTNKTVAVHTSGSTIIRRYSPESVKFDDAKAGTLGEIRAGDQLRARGTRRADGSELAAEEIVSGTFRNIAGTVASADAGNNTISVMDLVTKKAVTLRVNTDSQLRKLPQTFAQRIAMRLKGGSSEGNAAGNQSSETRQGDGGAGAGRPHGTPDFQQMLARLPAVTLADLQKGDAVMIVSTMGTADTQPTAITLLTGVEPILMAAPDSTRAAMLLSPWNLGGGADAAAGAGPQ